MNKLYLFIALVVFASGCATSSSLKKIETVTIILNGGDKIKAQVLDISQEKVTISANNWDKAYKYGEVLPRDKIAGIKLKDGTVLTVAEYEKHRKGLAENKSKSEKSKTAVVSGKSPEMQYEDLKSKPIAEMTDNEFKFFMMMKAREDEEKKLAERNTFLANERKLPKPVPPSEPVVVPLPVTRPEINVAPPNSLDRNAIEEIANSLVKAGLATDYLKYLEGKKQADNMTATESQIKTEIEKNEKWQGDIDELLYLNRLSEKALSQVYLHNPAELKSVFGLEFDENLEMDYRKIMAQLHSSLGSKVGMNDYRKLIDVFGESEGKAIKQLLENYAALQFVLENQKTFTEKQ